MEKSDNQDEQIPCSICGMYNGTCDRCGCIKPNVIDGYCDECWDEYWDSMNYGFEY